MLHEACNVVEDAGGWTCRTCGAHWRTSVAPSGCAEDWPPVGPTRGAVIVVGTLSALCVLALLGAFVGPALRAAAGWFAP